MVQGLPLGMATDDNDEAAFPCSGSTYLEAILLFVIDFGMPINMWEVSSSLGSGLEHVHVGSLSRGLSWQRVSQR